MNQTIESEKHERFWYALYTRPRFEKKVDLALKQKKLVSFLPLQTVIRFWSNGRRKVQEPLFPSYVFVHADLRERYIALQSYGVARLVCFNGQPTTIPDEQIQAVRQILYEGYALQPHQYLAYGDEVEIVRGPLRGLRGFYLEDRGERRVVISVRAVRQSIAIAVRKGEVRRLGSRCIQHTSD